MTMITTPMHVVSRVLLMHVKEVFAENYALGNFYLNPETEMYIRADFPEADSDVGFKPGIIIKTVGGLNDETPGIGQQGYIPQLREYYPTIEGYDDLYTGTCVLQAVAQHEQEALNIAYLTMLSINKFKSHLLGREGIVDVHAMSLSDVYPYRAGAYVDAFASDIQVRYAKREAFTTTKGEVPLTKINIKVNPE